MAVQNYKELLEHLDHDIEVADYTAQGGQIANVAIECMTCNEVLVDFDNPSWVNQDA